MKEKIIYFCQLLRVKHWTKNSFIFFPLLFSGRLIEKIPLVNCLIAFSGFCIVSSSVYILNDLLDMKKDMHHPKKANRPLVRYKGKRSTIIFVILILMFLGLYICFLVSDAILYTSLIYIFLHLVYNFYTKKVVILDGIFIAAGFQIRIWAGSLASGVIPSVWLQMCVFILALFLGYTKRRYEISALKDKASEHRSVLAHYTSYLLDQIIIICSTLAIVFYGLYTISGDIIYRVGNYNMVYSIVFVIYGIFRYLYIVHVKKGGGDPGEILLSDAPFIINVVLWIGYIYLLIYVL